MLYVTKLDHPEYSDKYNVYDGYRHPVVLHKDHNWHLGRFPSMEKLAEFMSFAGLELGEMTEERDEGKCGWFRSWNVTPSSIEEHGFWSRQDVPDEAKAITALSNGSLVTCYILNDGDTLHIYRPNPNAAEDVYNPLSIEEHIKFCRTNGYI